jgi:glycosyltransferase involved in cell wall biosynthesis
MSSMRIAIAARPSADERKTGVGHYIWQMLRLLPELDPDATYVAWYPDGAARSRFRQAKETSSSVPLPNLVERWTPLPQAWFDRFDFPRLEWLLHFDVLFAPNFVPPPTRTRRLVVTVHDLAFKLFPETAPVARASWQRRFEEALREAAEVIAVSEATRRDLLRLYSLPPENVSVVPLGVDLDVFRPAAAESVEEVRVRYGITDDYLLFLGGIEPRKNLVALVEAFESLTDVPPAGLVFAGPAVAWNPRGSRILHSALDALSPEIKRRIVLTGYVSQEDKVALLSGARALVLPSLYEGFGLPILEAMACGTPVLTSNRSALPETAGGAALLVDPTDTAAIAEGIRRLLTDGALRQELRTRGLTRAGGFDWRQTARQTAALLHRAARA